MLQTMPRLVPGRCPISRELFLKPGEQRAENRDELPQRLAERSVRGLPSTLASLAAHHAALVGADRVRPGFSVGPAMPRKTKVPDSTSDLCELLHSTNGPVGESRRR
jgi:hypothetical protein